MAAGTLYLIPCPISDETAPWDVLPASNRAVMDSLDYFIVENTRTARRFLSKAGVTRPIDELEFRELNEHTVAEREVGELVKPLLAGRSAGVISEAGEHLVANVVMRQLAAAFDAVGPNPPTPPAIVGAPSGITHELGLMAFAVALRRAGVATIYLGSDVPPGAWAEAVGTTGAAIGITAIPRRSDGRRVAALSERLNADHPGVPLAVGGQFQHLGPPGCVRLGHRIAPAARAVAQELAGR